MRDLLRFLIWLLEELAGIDNSYGIMIEYTLGDITICKRVEKGDISMYTVKGTTEDKRFSIAVGEVKDSEGSTIPTSDFTVSVPESDNESAIQILDPIQAEGQVQGTIHFGTPAPNGEPNIANVRYDIMEISTGLIVGSVVETFNVTHGDAATVNAPMVIEGLTPDPPTA